MTNQTTPTISDSDYVALRQGAALLQRTESNILLVRGDDRVDFLQRMSTNNIAALQPGQSTVTVLTSPVARILSVFTVLHQGDELLLFPTAGESENLARTLRGQIFFMDNVTVESPAQPHTRVRLMGPRSETLLQTVGLLEGPLLDEHWQRTDNITVLKQSRYDVPGFELALPTAALPDLLDRVQSAGGILLDGAVAYTIARIESGRPAPGAELVEAYTPLETGLGWACADDKGCYTGQEIIARQITYDKITRSLVGIVATTPVTAGAELKLDKRTVGTVTSAAYHPQRDASIALAVVKRQHNVAGTELTLNGNVVHISALPLPAA